MPHDIPMLSDAELMARLQNLAQRLSPTDRALLLHAVERFEETNEHLQYANEEVAMLASGKQI